MERRLDDEKIMEDLARDFVCDILLCSIAYCIPFQNLHAPVRMGEKFDSAVFEPAV